MCHFFSTLHIQTGLVTAGFAYVLKCLARAEAVEGIFNLVSLQRSCVIHCLQKAGGISSSMKEKSSAVLKQRLHERCCYLGLTQIPLTVQRAESPHSLKRISIALAISSSFLTAGK